ncbi:phage tail protein, partial [Vibrio cholerae]
VEIQLPPLEPPAETQEINLWD